MALNAAFQMSASSAFSCSSTKIKLILVMLTLACETCIHVVAEADQASSSANLGEVADEIGNPMPPTTDNDMLSSNPLSIEDSNDLAMYKRHLGAIAALSGSRQFAGSKSFAPPSKKHLGSIAAAAAHSVGRTPGRKLELILPSKVEMYKRHLGALMALTGTKPRPLTRSLKDSSGYQMDAQADTFELETPPMSFTNSKNYAVEGGNGMESESDIIMRDQIQSSAPGSLVEYADELSPSSSENEFQRMNNGEILDQNLESGMLGGVDVGAYKSKRFLGPLARGGWFPRHFRGIVSPNTFGKRHIGALARLGWMPNAKGNSRLGMALDEQRGEIGLKRNDVLPRRRMLYHFTAPSLWTSPRGK